MIRRTSLHQAIDTMRAMSQALLRDRRFGARAGDVLILMAVAIGDAEGKPMTAYKIAGYIGIPNPSVLRRLSNLTRAGLVRRDDGKRYSLTDEGSRRFARAP